MKKRRWRKEKRGSGSSFRKLDKQMKRPKGNGGRRRELEEKEEEDWRRKKKKKKKKNKNKKENEEMSFQLKKAWK
ncbi:hypothetical protein M8J76_012446 [Diaphorina citri]|nr:hypothetical protein M8J76_012446 [Diaphorina citri]